MQVYTDDNIFVLIEASKALLKIGVWDTAALEILLQSIKYGSQDLRCSLLEVLRNSANPHLINKVLRSHSWYHSAGVGKHHQYNYNMLQYK